MRSGYGYPLVPIGDRLPGSTLDETDNCWFMRWSVALWHDPRVSKGAREGGQVLGCFPGAAGTWPDRGGACKGGEWWTDPTEEGWKCEADDRGPVGIPKVLGLGSSLLLLVVRVLLNSPSGIGIRPMSGMSSISARSSSVL